MNNKIEYNDVFAFHPGYYISEIIDDMGLNQEEFAIRMGTTPKTLSKLVNGQTNLTNDLSQKLATMLGTSVDVWLNLQQKYNEKIIEIDKAKIIDAQKEVMSNIDYSYFVKVAGLPPTTDIKEKILHLCAFLKIADLRILLKPDFLASHRTGIGSLEDKNLINARAWLQTAMNFAKDLEVSPFDPEKLKSFLPEIRSMTLQKPDVFIPRLRQVFSESGVVFILLPHLKNSGINGAVKWCGRDKVVLAMNDRGCYADTFWFSLAHEIRHVFQQKIKTVFLSPEVKDIFQIESDLESDADKFAQEFLIPAREYAKLNLNGDISKECIVDFAESIGIDPGIVVGRLQHDKIIAQNQYVYLKKKYKILLR